MIITRTSQVSGITRTLDLDVTEAELAVFHEGVTTLQDCFPRLSSDDREFIKTGITTAEWEQLFHAHL